MSVRGYLRGSTWDRSAQSWSVVGWLLLCVSTASFQWFAASFTVTPGTCTAPVLDPPAPQNKSVIVSVIACLNPLSWLVPGRRRGCVVLHHGPPRAGGLVGVPGRLVVDHPNGGRPSPVEVPRVLVGVGVGDLSAQVVGRSALTGGLRVEPKGGELHPAVLVAAPAGVEHDDELALRREEY